MRYLSKVFQPIITIPKNAKIKNTEITCKSQKLLLECGLVRPTSSGLFALLPLGRRALHKLERLCRQAVEEAGAQQMSLPALSAAALWEASGRRALPDLLRVSDRHGKEYLLAPTHEESIADLLADVGPLSYKQLPLLLYQISNKYRDECRPKHGLLRAREFLMLDAYGAHPGEECAERVYSRVGRRLADLFRRLQLPVHRVCASSGDMGGAVSHEWQVAAGAGEDEIAVCASCSHAHPAPQARCTLCGRDTHSLASIEVGHTFILGTKYSEALGALYTPPSGPSAPLVMSCYGIGLTRLLAASLEALSSEHSLRWPEPIAPYDTLIIPPKEGSKEWSANGPEAIRRVYDAVTGAGCERDGDGAGAGRERDGDGAGAGRERDGDGEGAGRERDAIVDDRHALTIGKRLVMAQRMGYPCVVVMGRATLDATPRYEVHTRDSNPRLLTLEQLAHLAQPQHTLETNVA